MDIKVKAGILLLGSFMLVSCTSSSEKPFSSRNQGAVSKSEQKSQADSSESPRTNTDVRNLITKAEAEAAIGEPVKDVKYKDSGNQLGQKIVFYAAASPTSFNSIELSVIQTNGMESQLKSAGHDAAKEFKNIKATLTSPQNIAGLGDEAYWDAAGRLASSLHVLKKDTYFMIVLATSDKSKQLKIEKELAQKVLDRLSR